MMKKLSTYELCSGKLVNKGKSCFLVAPNTPQFVVDDIHHITGFNYSKFPFTYFGCPICKGRKKVIYYVT